MVLDVVKESGMDILGGGKIEGLFAHRGLSKSNHSGNNMAGVDAILDFLGLIIANLVDFDALYGHSNNPHGYADALQAFDNRLSKIMRNLRPDNVLLITADHGNDPTTLSKDHSRERVPIMIIGELDEIVGNLGTRDRFADVVATIADLLEVNWFGSGESFAKNILVPGD